MYHFLSLSNPVARRVFTDANTDEDSDDDANEDDAQQTKHDCIILFG